jgi:short subunit dehydrogenase
MVDTDVLGVMYMTHAAPPHLLRARGTVVQLSSLDGRTAGALTGVYNAGKWAVNAFSESLRQEVTTRGSPCRGDRAGSDGYGPGFSHHSHPDPRSCGRVRRYAAA